MRSQNYRKVNILFIGNTYVTTTLNDIEKINKRIGATHQSRSKEDEVEEGKRLYYVSKRRLTFFFVFLNKICQ